jgi:hypothetical protein
MSFFEAAAVEDQGRTEVNVKNETETKDKKE